MRRTAPWRQLEALLARGLALGLSPVGAVDALLAASAEPAPRGLDRGHLSALRALLAEGQPLDEALQRAGAPAPMVQALSGGGLVLESEAYVAVAATARRRVRWAELADALSLPLLTLLSVATFAGALTGYAEPVTSHGGLSPGWLASLSWALLAGVVALVLIGLRWPRVAGRLPFVRGVSGRERAGYLAGRLAAHVDVGTPVADALDIVGLRRAGRAFADGVPLAQAVTRHGIGRWLAPELTGAVDADLASALRDAQAACWATVDDRWRAWVVLVRGGATLGLAVLVLLVLTTLYSEGLGQVWQVGS